MAATESAATSMAVAARSGSPIGPRRRRRSHEPAAGPSGCPISWSCCCASIARPRQPSVKRRPSCGTKVIGCSPRQTGAPINPRTDYADGSGCSRWPAFAMLACMMRATPAATVLLILGVPEQAVMKIMGWSHSAMAARYQHYDRPRSAGHREPRRRADLALNLTRRLPPETAHRLAFETRTETKKPNAEHSPAELLGVFAGRGGSGGI